jgi:suppressor for copper-sensitivity B
VLVDVTADWCITCKVNKSLVLERGPVLELLEGESLAALKADWTNPDPAIAAYLESFGRYGIPFNAVYGPGAPEGIALPELLTESAVLEAVEKARGG